MSELDQIVLLGDGVLVEAPVIKDKVGSLHLPNGAGKRLLETLSCKVVKVGPGDRFPMPIQVGDIAIMPNGPQYSEVMFDNKIYYIIAQHNVLFVKRNQSVDVK